MRVEDVMSVDVATVAPETSLKDAAQQLACHAISGMPAVDDGGRISGVISEADVLAEEQPEPERGAGFMTGLLGRDRSSESLTFAARVVSEA